VDTTPVHQAHLALQVPQEVQEVQVDPEVLVVQDPVVPMVQVLMGQDSITQVSTM
jgi:hypothetical protein